MYNPFIAQNVQHMYRTKDSVIHKYTNVTEIHCYDLYVNRGRLIHVAGTLPVKARVIQLLALLFYVYIYTGKLLTWFIQTLK